jgi:hypothetical protein
MENFDSQLECILKRLWLRLTDEMNEVLESLVGRGDMGEFIEGQLRLSRLVKGKQSELGLSWSDRPRRGRPKGRKVEA